MREKIVAGNWKMNVLPSETNTLIKSIIDQMPSLPKNCHVVFGTPAISFANAKSAIEAGAKSNVWLGGQNFYPKSNGAYTGELSIPMLQDAGARAVIIGHSERRQYFAESNSFIKAKVDAALEANLLILFCCGEPLEVREAASEKDYVAQQLKESIFHLGAEVIASVVIAYEPIWAIGTGKTATTQQAQDMHAFIRSTIAAQYNHDVANKMVILYGGSCNASNAAELFSQPDVDGGLIGGASLKAETFVPIIEAMVAANA